MVVRAQCDDWCCDYDDVALVMMVMMVICDDRYSGDDG